MITETQVLPHVRLQYHIKHPVFEECWNEGYDVAKDNLGEELNPYAESSTEYEYWEQGWWAGFYGEERIFAENGASEIIPYHQQQPLSALSVTPAANEETFTNTRRVWINRALKIAGAIALTVAVIELIDLAA